MTLSDSDSVGVYDDAEFAANPEQRCSVIMILDKSESMNRGGRIGILNEALAQFEKDVKEDALTALRADIAIIAFSNEPEVVQDFINGTEFQAPNLDASGGTNYSKAVNLAMDLSETRKQSYRDNGISYLRTLIFFLTDGLPEHDDATDLVKTAQRIREAETERKIAFLAFGIGTPSEPVRMSALEDLSARPPQKLNNNEQLKASIEWLANSITVFSETSPDEPGRLPDLDFLDL